MGVLIRSIENKTSFPNWWSLFNALKAGRGKSCDSLFERNAIARACLYESVKCVKPCSKICYWNIHVWSSKIIGNKLTDSEFLGKISDCDIVALSEIHSDKELSLPGFISIKQKIRK